MGVLTAVHLSADDALSVLDRQTSFRVGHEYDEHNHEDRDDDSDDCGDDSADAVLELADKHTENRRYRG